MTLLRDERALREVATWQNSPMAVSMLVDHAELNDDGVILEEMR